jgi:hypothetical protein
MRIQRSFDLLDVKHGLMYDQRPVHGKMIEYVRSTADLHVRAGGRLP